MVISPTIGNICFLSGKKIKGRWDSEVEPSSFANATLRSKAFFATKHEGYAGQVGSLHRYGLIALILAEWGENQGGGQ